MARTALIEVLLFIAPFAIYAIALFATRRDAREREHWHPRAVLSLAIAGLLLVIGGLVFFTHFGGAPPGSSYEPAHMEDGRLVPGRIKSK
jgi:amino acid transporter